MRIEISYGKKGLEIEVPDKNLVKVLSMTPATALPNPEAAIASALDDPVASEPLEKLAHGLQSACVVICDITRAVPNALILKPLLMCLEAAGIPRENITILIATGLHRPSSREELIHLVGKEISGQYRLVDHHARIQEEHRFLGTTMRGTPVWIDRRYCEADLKITTASIEPHLMAGFSGGRKMVAPGCAGVETIKVLHSPAILEDPRCREGCLEGNPLHDEMLSIAKMAGHDFIIDVALDEKGRMTGIFAGDPEEAHGVGVQHIRKTVKSTLKEPADIVITTAAGHPLDLTYYQAIKGMTAALPVLKPGGTLILAAECSEGLGNDEFRKMATSFASADSFREWILSNPVLIDQWQLEECAKAALWADVVLVASGIPKEERSGLFVRTATSVEDALSKAFGRHGKEATVAVIPKGPSTLVQVE
ncbi:MAG: nickel-dependent lactate racemase [Ignavibacteriales bacterium]|nr:nickel-dependent lactate racemase [Ignavibacteriales bacterium]